MGLERTPQTSVNLDMNVVCLIGVGSNGKSPVSWVEDQAERQSGNAPSFSTHWKPVGASSGWEELGPNTERE